MEISSEIHQRACTDGAVGASHQVVQTEDTPEKAGEKVSSQGSSSVVHDQRTISTGYAGHSYYRGGDIPSLLDRGVDVFFVISGYLIHYRIMKDCSLNKLSYTIVVVYALNCTKFKSA